MVVNCTHQITKEVTQRIDRPASSDNEAHCVEGLFHVRLVYLSFGLLLWLFDGCS